MEILEANFSKCKKQKFLLKLRIFTTSMRNDILIFECVYAILRRIEWLIVYNIKNN